MNTLKYELENIKQERDLVGLRHEKELRDLQLKADADFRKAQVRLMVHCLPIAIISDISVLGCRICQQSSDA